MVQSLQQRLANEKFHKAQQKKMGKPDSGLKSGVAPIAKKTNKTSPINKWWFILLAFVVFGGLIFEFVRLIFAWFA